MAAGGFDFRKILGALGGGDEGTVGVQPIVQPAAPAGREQHIAQYASLFRNLNPRLSQGAADLLAEQKVDEVMEGVAANLRAMQTQPISRPPPNFPEAARTLHDGVTPDVAAPIIRG